MRLTIKNKILSLASVLILKRPLKIKQLFLQETIYKPFSDVNEQRFNQI
ncbi:MAG: hypothetical protein ACRAS9_02365 [Mycoplasma sp.]